MGMVGTVRYALFVFVLVLYLARCDDIISTIAGTGSTSYIGDGGQATSATLYYPYGICLDSSGSITIIVICCFYL